MAKILIRVASEFDRERIVSALEDQSHHLVGGDRDPEPSDYPAEIITDSKADLVITDYIDRDALSVKIMQDVALRAPFTRFLFIPPQDIPPQHLILALNEGAAALTPSPVDPIALRNYVNRAIARQKQERQWAAEVERCREAAEREKAGSMERTVEISRLKRSLQIGYRLINHLLAVNMTRNKPTVLLVTDSTYQADRFRQVLLDHNFQVLAAKNGAEGLDVARKEHPKIIVSDLEMPELNGIELCKTVKNDESLAPNYFIICTANEDKIQDVLKPENKVDDCLLKPMHHEDFQEFIAKVAFGLIT